MSIWKYHDRLPAIPESARLTLGEGMTPLVRSRRIGPSVGLSNLYFKVETTNPTGSYKDRFAAMGISHMVAEGKRRCFATSSGNSGSALATYCAVADIECTISIIEKTTAEKLLQMQAYGATCHRIKGFGIDPDISRDTFEAVMEQGRQPGADVQLSLYTYSPIGMAGCETISFELADKLDGEIDHVFSPGGGGGLTLAIARGFGGSGPAVHCVQPEGNDTIAGPLRLGLKEGQNIASSETGIGGLQVPTLIDGNMTIDACRASGGTGHLVSDQEVFELQRRLAQEEGIFSEPAGAVALAGALRAHEGKEVGKDDVIVCLVTGSGFKDSESVRKFVKQSKRSIPRP
jgi:threonine synthase